MKTTTKPEITLKGIKHFAAMSRETYCYEATIYVDGKRWGRASNDGGGGPDLYEPLEGGWEATKELDERIRETHPSMEAHGIELEASLELLCGDLVTDWLRRKDFKRALKRITYVKEGETGIYQLPAKHKPNAATLAICQRTKWGEKAVFLNELPEAEAWEIWQANT